MRCIMACRSDICWRMYSTVRLRTRPSERPWPSRPGTSSVRRSKPSRMACRRFCSGRRWSVVSRAGSLRISHADHLRAGQRDAGVYKQPASTYTHWENMQIIKRTAALRTGSDVVLLLLLLGQAGLVLAIGVGAVGRRRGVVIRGRRHDVLSVGVNS